MRRLVRLDGSSPPAAKEELIDKAHGAKGKENEAHQCLLPVCALRERTGVNDVQCNVLMRMRNFLQKVRQWMYDITSHSTFDVIIVILILLNTIVLALYHHGIGPEFRHVLDSINLVSVIMTHFCPLPLILFCFRKDELPYIHRKCLSILEFSLNGNNSPKYV